MVHYPVFAGGQVHWIQPEAKSMFFVLFNKVLILFPIQKQAGDDVHDDMTDSDGEDDTKIPAEKLATIINVEIDGCGNSIMKAMTM